MVSAVVRSLAPASVIAGRVLGFGSPHLKQSAVSWATMPAHSTLSPLHVLEQQLPQ